MTGRIQSTHINIEHRAEMVRMRIDLLANETKLVQCRQHREKATRHCISSNNNNNSYSNEEEHTENQIERERMKMNKNQIVHGCCCCSFFALYSLFFHLFTTCIYLLFLVCACVHIGLSVFFWARHFFPSALLLKNSSSIFFSLFIHFGGFCVLFSLAFCFKTKRKELLFLYGRHCMANLFSS